MKHLLLTFLSAITLNLWAQLNTDRPSFSDNSYVLPSGSFQNENGFNIAFIHDPISSQNQTHYQLTLPFSSFRYGLTQKVELRLASALLRNSQNTTNQYGISDLEMGVKVQLRKHVAWISHIGIPNGSSSYSNNKPFLVNKISATLAGDKTSLTMNIGLTSFESPINQRSQRNWLNTLVLLRNINAETYVYAEAFLQYNVNGGGIERTVAQTPGFDFGFAHKLSENSQIDFSYGYLGEDPFINLGISWGAFNKEKKRFQPLITPEF